MEDRLARFDSILGTVGNTPVVKSTGWPRRA